MMKRMILFVACVVVLLSNKDSTAAKLSDQAKYTMFQHCIKSASTYITEEQALSHCACVAEAFAKNMDDKAFEALEQRMIQGDAAANEIVEKYAKKCM